jgi:CubicO group peptidase (beta-lactamase class C family)
MPSPSDLGFCPTRLGWLAEWVARAVESGHIPGAAMLLARQGEIAFERAWGVRSVDTRTPMGLDSLFRLYSMSKPITSVAAMMLAERGVWSLHEPVHAYIPAFAGLQVGVEVPDPNAAGGRRLLLEPAQRPMTLHDLLRHTSGLTYGIFETSLVKDAYRAAGVDSRRQTNQQLLERLTTVPLACQPGQAWEYSRSTDVLGALIELVTGRTLATFLHEEIFAPLGMRDTDFHVPHDQLSRVAQPFSHDPDSGAVIKLAEVDVPPTFEAGGSGLVSSMHDTFRFMRMMANGGELEGIRLLSPNTVRWMTSDHLGNIPRGSHYLPGEGYGFGLGFAVRLSDGGAPVSGTAGDFYWCGLAGTYAWCDPARNLIGLWMMQAPGARHRYWALARNMSYAALLH